MPVVAEEEDSTTVAAEDPPNPNMIRPRNPDTDPNSSRYKPTTTISSILLNDTSSTSHNNNNNNNKNKKKKKNFSSAAFRGLGCTASSQSQLVSVPSLIRTSANWEPPITTTTTNNSHQKKRVKKPKKTTLLLNNHSNNSSDGNPVMSQLLPPLPLSLSSSSCVGVPDVWCGPGIAALASSTDAAPVEDCVVSRRATRAKVDAGVVLGHRHRSTYNARRMVIPEDIPFLEDDDDAGLAMPRFRADISGSRHHRHARHAFREGFAEIVLLQGNLLMGGRLDGRDRYRDLRLDVDNMSYEELLELGDRIGYVSTGLREDDIDRCLKMSKLAVVNDFSSHFATEMERKCSICQEEYEPGDETGKLNCGHFYHIDCIKQWLGQKNMCPICKTAAASQS